MRLREAAKKDAGGNVLEADDMLIFVAGHADTAEADPLLPRPDFQPARGLTAPTASDRTTSRRPSDIDPARNPRRAGRSAPASTPAAARGRASSTRPGVVPETPSAPVVPAVAASYAAAEVLPAALEPAPAELSDPGVDVIEYAPAELSEPAPAAADQDDDAPPLEAFDSMPPADDQAEAGSRPTWRQTWPPRPPGLSPMPRNPAAPARLAATTCWPTSSPVGQHRGRR